MNYPHIFLFANLADDLIGGHHNLGGETSFASVAIQVLRRISGEPIPYVIGGAIGKDPSGEFLKKTLQSYDVDITGLRTSQTPSRQVLTKGVKNATFIGYRGGPFCQFTEVDKERFRPLCQEPGWFFLTSNTFIDPETWGPVRSTLLESPRLIFFDLNWRKALLKESGYSENEFLADYVLFVLERSTIIKVTETEMSFLERSLNRKRSQFFELWKKLQWIVVTNGPEEIQLLQKDGNEFHQKPPQVQEIQDTGAGDIVSGAMLFCLSHFGVQSIQDLENLSDRSVEKMLSLANQMASMVIQGFGVDYLMKHQKEISFS